MKLMVIASHPVQYHAPVFRQLAKLLAEKGWEFVVVYLSDFSAKSFQERDFGVELKWDEPLLEGYRSIVLDGVRTAQPKGFWDLRAKGFHCILKAERPTRILMHTLIYIGAIEALFMARLLGIPVTLRVETNDEAYARSRIKSWLRYWSYRVLYSLCDSAIAFGSLNRKHLVRHGMNPARMPTAYYCVPDRFLSIGAEDKAKLRDQLRCELDIPADSTCLLFSGKLIPKKAPELILQALALMTEQQRSRFTLVYLGSGELEALLKQQAASLTGLAVHFVGFRNQTELPPYYLAADVLILPSRKAGEVWGLVVNEALQAGLPVIMSQAVGCSEDFGSLPDVRVFATDHAGELSKAIASTSGVSRSFSRYADAVHAVSVDLVSRKISDFFTP